MNTAGLGTLGRQSLRRPLTAAEAGLAKALEEIYAGGQHDFGEVVAELQRRQTPRPSAATEPWTVAILQKELELINASFDQAYAGQAPLPAGA